MFKKIRDFLGLTAVGGWLGKLFSDSSEVEDRTVVGMTILGCIVACVFQHLRTQQQIQSEILYVLAAILGGAMGFSVALASKVFTRKKTTDTSTTETKTDKNDNIVETVENKTTVEKTQTPIVKEQVVEAVPSSPIKREVKETIEDADILDGLKENFKKPTQSIDNKPKDLLTAGSFYIGTTEVSGSDSNKAILEFAKRADISWYKDDSTPWCAVFVNAMCDLCGLPETKSAMAKSFVTWGHGISIEEAQKDNTNVIGVFHRGNPASSSGHVAILKQVSSDGKTASMLGGNQSDKVCIQNFKLDDKFVGFRRA